MAISEDEGFGPRPDSETPGGCSPALLVVSPERAAVTRALRRAAARLWRVLPDGTESGAEAIMDETPISYVSEPGQLVRGVDIGVDFESEDLTPEMGEAYRRIVIEDLVAEGISDASLVDPEPVDFETGDEAMFVAPAPIRSISRPTWTAPRRSSGPCSQRCRPAH